MKTTFEKQEFNADFDHTSPIVAMFNEMGYSDFSIETSLTNGLSHYVKLTVDVLNEGKCWADMFIMDNKTNITVRISDIVSGLERNCGGVCGNKMTLSAFKKLIQTGAIKSTN
jgi:hypothetical protein